MSKFGTKLKQNIKLAGLTNIEFAEKTGLSANYVSILINDNTRLPKLDNFNKMLEVLEPRISTDDFLDLSQIYTVEKFGLANNKLINDLSDEEQNVINSFKLLTDHQQFLIKSQIEEYRRLNLK
ncbi:helix-turn-helix transcriptional regulator [Lentisphaerota bacterium WC36G]|nr:helix-turn-helix domain-containing protein [Lentisphaerae bacterium WC36]